MSRDSSSSTLLSSLFSLAITLISSCRGVMVEPWEAQKTLDLHGYTDVVIGERAFVVTGLRGCNATDAARIEFKAKPPGQTKAQYGYVCTGWPFKGGAVHAP